MLHKLFITTFLLFCTTTIFAQTEVEVPEKSYPATAIRELKDGILIVRLTSEFKKLKELNRILEEGDISASTRARLPHQIQKITEERDAENSSWITHFKNEYTFSDVYFAYDTLRKEALLGNDGRNCFLNQDFEIDLSLSLDGKNFLMLYEETLPESEAEAVVFRDASFQHLSKPFPYYVKTTGFMLVFNSIFKNSIAEDRNIRRVVRKLNKNMEKFYEKS